MMTGMKRFRVQVVEKRVFWQEVEVDAKTWEEAEQLAIEAFECDWSNSECEDITVTRLREDGQDVVTEETRKEKNNRRTEP